MGVPVWFKKLIWSYFISFLHLLMFWRVAFEKRKNVWISWHFFKLKSFRYAVTGKLLQPIFSEGCKVWLWFSLWIITSIGLQNSQKQICKIPNHQNIWGLGSFRYAVTGKSRSEEKNTFFQNSLLWVKFFELDMLQDIHTFDKNHKIDYPSPTVKFWRHV